MLDPIEGKYFIELAQGDSLETQNFVPIGNIEVQ